MLGPQVFPLHSLVVDREQALLGLKLLSPFLLPFSSWCVSSACMWHMCVVHVCECVGAHTCAHSWGGHRKTSGVFLYCFPAIVTRQVFHQLFCLDL